MVRMAPSRARTADCWPGSTGALERDDGGAISSRLRGSFAIGDALVLLLVAGDLDLPVLDPLLDVAKPLAQPPTVALGKNPGAQLHRLALHTLISSRSS